MKSTDCNLNGEERRKNGRIKLTAGDYIKIISTIIVMLVTSAVAWANLKGNVNAIAKETDVSTKCNTIQDKRLDIVETKQQEIHSNVKAMRLAQEDMSKLLYKIDGKLDRNGNYQ